MKRYASLLIFTLIAAAPLGVSADDGNGGLFGIRQIRSGSGQREVIRFNKQTGESWFNWTTSAPTWSKVPESGPVPAGDYDVLLLPGVENDSVWVIRFDSKSGKTWNYGSKGWEEFSEPK